MTSCSDEILNHYFNELEKLRDDHDVVADSSHHDDFAHLCLKIAAVLLDDSYLTRAIAKELSLIVDFKDHATAKEDLFVAVRDIDQNLEGHLRGFSGLMELIVEDTRIRRDPLAALFGIEQRAPELAHAFCRLVGAFDAFLNLEEALSLDFSKAACALFLVTITDIKRHVFANGEQDSQESIFEWLSFRVKNEAMTKLYCCALAARKAALTEIDTSALTEDLVVVLLCSWSADLRIVTREEAALIDKILLSMGMVGIEPLVLAGFLEIEDCSKDSKVFLTNKIHLAT